MTLEEFEDGVLVVDVFNMIESGLVFPKNYTTEEKEDFLKRLFSFYEKKEEYEKCNRVKEILESGIHL